MLSYRSHKGGACGAAREDSGGLWAAHTPDRQDTGQQQGWIPSGSAIQLNCNETPKHVCSLNVRYTILKVAKTVRTTRLDGSCRRILHITISTNLMSLAFLASRFTVICDGAILLSVLPGLVFLVILVGSLSPGWMGILPARDVGRDAPVDPPKVVALLARLGGVPPPPPRSSGCCPGSSFSQCFGHLSSKVCRFPQGSRGALLYCCWGISEASLG